MPLTRKSFQKSLSWSSPKPACATRVGEEINSGSTSPLRANASHSSSTASNVPPPIRLRSYAQPVSAGRMRSSGASWSRLMGTAMRNPVQRGHYGHRCGRGATSPAFLPPKSAGSAPPDEVFEQLVALAFRDRARSSGRDLSLRQELFELIAPGAERLLAMVLEPIVGAFETLPARNDGGEIGVLPLRMTWSFLEF